MSRALVSALVALLALAGCGQSTTSPSLVAPSATVVPTVTPAATVAATPVPTATSLPTAALPTTFTSLLYEYTIVVPAGWPTGAAMIRWDAASSPGDDDSSVDKFAGPAGLSAFAFAGPVRVDLAGFVKETIAWTVRDHGDTCPATAPEVTEPIEIGGEPGMLLSWDCGILINEALLVRKGTGFVVVIRDLDVKAATDPADRAILQALLDSITFLEK